MRRYLSWASIAAFVLLLAACAASPTAGYHGPTANLADSGFAESQGKGQLFVVASIDGNRVANSEAATRGSSQGMGFAQRIQLVERSIPARPMKVGLKGTHTTGAPIAAIFSQVRGTFFEVEGTVDFTPEPGKRYIVKGELAKEGSRVWIEDADSDRRVTETVTSR